MLLFWRIRYLDSRDKEFKDRDLCLDTDTLDPPTRAAVELHNDLRESGDQRAMIRFRYLFREKKDGESDFCSPPDHHRRCAVFCVPDYFEDENGDQLSNARMGQILTGNPNAVMFPSGTKRHDMDYALADKSPLAIADGTLTPEQLNLLGYFARDLRELLNSAFFKDGPGELIGLGGTAPTIRTAVSDEEIRSFVTVFRRLYMEKDPANFMKACSLFTGVTGAHPIGKWVEGTANQYQEDLQHKPNIIPMPGSDKWPFSRKRLIDVFLYTQYAHQPDERRVRQYHECLKSVGGNRDLLFWLFLATMQHSSAHMANAGRVIARWFDSYCKAYGCPGDVLPSLSDTHGHLGSLEKKEARRERLYHQRVGEVATGIWKERGCPFGGPSQFWDEANRSLQSLMSNDDKR